MTARRPHGLRFVEPAETRAVEAAMDAAAAPLSMPHTDRVAISRESDIGRICHMGAVRVELWRCHVSTVPALVRDLEQARAVIDAALAVAKGFGA